MKRPYRRLLNFFAFALLAFAIYLNFFYKEQDSVLPVNATSGPDGTAALSRYSLPEH